MTEKPSRRREESRTDPRAAGVWNFPDVLAVDVSWLVEWVRDASLIAIDSGFPAGATFRNIPEYPFFPATCIPSSPVNLTAL